MTRDQHDSYTQRLLATLSADPEVVGFVTLGSSSGLPPLPDAFSDHDFFVVTTHGSQERFRNDLRWLPDAKDVVLSFRETPHGVKALYSSGHLAEFAVFDVDELAESRVNRFRVLLDHADVAARLERVRAITAATAGLERPDDAWEAGQLLTNLVAGVGRAARGERISGHQLVRNSALGHLVALLRPRVPSERAAVLDDLDPFRRLEQALPLLAREVDAALQLSVVGAARAMLEIAAHERPDVVTDAARGAIERVIERAEAEALRTPEDES